jgi:hypothetical protein
MKRSEKFSNSLKAKTEDEIAKSIQKAIQRNRKGIVKNHPSTDSELEKRFETQLRLIREEDYPNDKPKYTKIWNDKFNSMKNDYLTSDNFAEMTEKGRHNLEKQNFEDEYLTEYIKQNSGVEIKFPNHQTSDDGKFASVEYKGTSIFYWIGTVINKFDKNYVKDFQDYYLSNYSGDEMIMIIDGKESVRFRSDMKDAVDQIQLNYLNISIMDVEEFIGWVEKN